MDIGDCVLVVVNLDVLFEFAIFVPVLNLDKILKAEG